MLSEPSFLVDDDTLRKVCEARAAICNQKARDTGHPSRVTASQLVDLYYAQGGRCSLTGISLLHHVSVAHPMRMELDHIRECRYRMALKQPNETDETIEFGSPADVSNLQWVCRFANQAKEVIRRSGKKYEDVVFGMAAMAQEPMRQSIRNAFLGASGARAFREEVFAKLLAENPLVSAPEACRHVAGTIGECCEATARRDLVRLGWKPRAARSYEELRAEAINAVVAANGLRYSTTLYFAELVCVELEAMNVWKKPSPHVIKNQAIDLGHAIEFDRVQRRERNVCAGDKSLINGFVREGGDDGIDEARLSDLASERRMSATLLTACIQELIDDGCVYRHPTNGNLVAALTRQEAARVIGVSPNRLKKIASITQQRTERGLPYFKRSEKGMTYYRRDDVSRFARERGSHALDLSVSGQRIDCVVGGHAGGRPPAKATGSPLRL